MAAWSEKSEKRWKSARDESELTDGKVGLQAPTRMVLEHLREEKSTHLAENGRDRRRRFHPPFFPDYLRAGSLRYRATLSTSRSNCVPPPT